METGYDEGRKECALLVLVMEGNYIDVPIGSCQCSHVVHKDVRSKL